MNIDLKTFESVLFLQGFLVILFVIFFIWFCSPRGCRTTTSIVRGSRRGDGNIAVRAAAGGSQREFGVETSHGEKKSGAAASGGARDDKTSETSTVQSISLSTSAPARTRNPISKQLHRKKGGSELRMQYCNVPECSYTTVKYCTSQSTSFNRYNHTIIVLVYKI